MPRLLAVLALALVGNAGCATTWAGLELAHAKWYNDHADVVTATAPVERRVLVEPVYDVPPPPPPEPAPVAVETPPPPPPPILLVPPPPAIVLVPPPPPPPPVWTPRGALRLSCSTESRNRREHVHTFYARYDAKWKVITGFMFVSEAVLSTIVFTMARRGDGSLDPAALTSGGVLAADAVGTAALFFHPLETWQEDVDRDGPWHAEPTCPAGTTVRIADGPPIPVAPDGSLGDAGRDALAAALAGAPIAVDVAGQERVFPVGANHRCAWARRELHPAVGDICADAHEWTIPRSLQLALALP